MGSSRTLGGGANRSAGIGINNAGQVVGSSNAPNVYFYDTHAFRYTGTPGSGGAMFDLGTLGGANSVGNAINDAGQVAGNSSTVAADDPDTHAFLYSGTPGSGGTIVDLGTLGGAECFANAINNAGQVAGISETATFASRHAFVYTGTPGSGGAMVDLGTLGGRESNATAINNSGQVVGSSSTTAGDPAIPFNASEFDQRVLPVTVTLLPLASAIRWLVRSNIGSPREIDARYPSIGNSPPPTRD